MGSRWKSCDLSVSFPQPLDKPRSSRHSSHCRSGSDCEILGRPPQGRCRTPGARVEAREGGTARAGPPTKAAERDRAPAEGRVQEGSERYDRPDRCPAAGRKARAAPRDPRRDTTIRLLLLHRAAVAEDLTQLVTAPNPDRPSGHTPEDQGPRSPARAPGSRPVRRGIAPVSSAGHHPPASGPDPDPPARRTAKSTCIRRPTGIGSVGVGATIPRSLPGRAASGGWWPRHQPNRYLLGVECTSTWQSGGLVGRDPARWPAGGDRRWRPARFPGAQGGTPAPLRATGVPGPPECGPRAGPDWVR